MKFAEWWEGHWKGAATGFLVFAAGTVAILAQQSTLFGPKTITGLTLAGTLAAAWLQLLKVDPTSRLAARLQARKLQKSGWVPVVAPPKEIGLDSAYDAKR